VVTPVLSLFVAELSEGATASGIIMAAMGAVSAVSALVIGQMGDRIGHTMVLSVCLVGSALSHFPQALVQQVWHLFLLRLPL